MSRRWRIWIGFALLIGISASAWIASAAWPVDCPVLLRFGVESIALSLILLPWAGRRWREASWRSWAEIAFWGAVLLAVPIVLEAETEPAISGVTATVIFTFVPAMVILILSQSEVRFGPESSSFGLLGVAMAGIAGAVLILPSHLPDSLAAYGLIAAAGVTGFAIARLHRLLQAAPLGASVATACAGSGLLALGVAVAHGVGSVGLRSFEWGHEVALFALVEGPIWVLSIWAIRSLRPAQFASRFLLVPLVTVAEGVVLVRPSISWTLVFGLGLLGFASWRLLADDSVDARDG